MIEILASLVVGALVVEWWQTYHGTPPPTPPAVSAPPPVRTAPAAQAPVIMPAEIAPEPAAEPRTAVAPRKAARPAAKATPAEVVVLPVVEELVSAGSPLSDSELAARARAFAADNDLTRAAADWAELLRRHPEDAEARRALVFALQGAGLPERALAVAGEKPSVFSTAEMAALYGDAADHAIALAVRGEPRPGRNTVLRGRADTALEQACRYAAENGIEAAVNRCESLRVVYLSGTGRHAAAVAAYNPAIDRMDDAAHTAAAHSLLAVFEVNAADDAFARRSTNAAPDDAFAIDRLFTRERLRVASRAIDDRIEQTPTRLKSADGSTNAPNWDRVILESERLRALAWRGKLKDAIAGQEDLVGRAPGDIDMRLQLADFYRYDGHRDLADAEVAKATALAPGNRAVLEAHIRHATEDGEFQDARRDLVTLRENWPADDGAADLRRAYDVASSPWIEASIGNTRAEGPGALVSPNDELTQRVAYYGHAWERQGDTRLFAFEEGDNGEYDTATSNPVRVGIGAMTRHRDWDAYASVHSRASTPEDAVGATLSGHVRFNDPWEAYATFQSDSTDTPLLALEDGIDAWSLDTGVQYNVRDGHYYALDAQQLDYDDGNLSLGVAFTGRQRFYADEPHQWSLIELVDTIGNDLPNQRYFSPDRMSAAELQLEYRGVLHALGPVRWAHIVRLGAGISEQSGYDNDPIADLRWEHMWSPNDHVEVGAGIELRRRNYDGIPEDHQEFFASLVWRLP